MEGNGRRSTWTPAITTARRRPGGLRSLLAAAREPGTIARAVARPGSGRWSRRWRSGSSSYLFPRPRGRRTGSTPGTTPCARPRAATTWPRWDRLSGCWSGSAAGAASTCAAPGHV